MTPQAAGLSAETLLALTAFAAATTWSPGPNNFMLASSGATFGLRRTMPHIMGVVFGFPLMVFVLTFGLGELFRSEPAVRSALAYVGFAVMLVFAARMAFFAGGGKSGTAARPLTFLAVALFQWVNPKAWAMCVAVAATYATGIAPWLDALVASAVFMVVGATSATSWAVAGSSIGRLLGSGRRLRAFNLAMALLLALSGVFLLTGG